MVSALMITNGVLLAAAGLVAAYLMVRDMRKPVPIRVRKPRR